MNTQSTHRLAIAEFWRTSHHNGKISPGWYGWGVHAHPLSAYYVPSLKVAVNAPAEWEDTLTLFHLCTLCVNTQQHSKFEKCTLKTKQKVLKVITLSNPSKPFLSASTCSMSRPVASTIRMNSWSCPSSPMVYTKKKSWKRSTRM